MTSFMVKIHIEPDPSGWQGWWGGGWGGGWMWGRDGRSTNKWPHKLEFCVKTVVLRYQGRGCRLPISCSAAINHLVSSHSLPACDGG